jgi:hypothetical protein
MVSAFLFSKNGVYTTNSSLKKLNDRLIEDYLLLKNSILHEKQLVRESIPRGTNQAKTMIKKMENQINQNKLKL